MNNSVCKYPCEECTRVACPDKCENKLCKEWKGWFLQRWNAIYAYGQSRGK